MPTWVLLAELIKNAGAYANVDIGNVNPQDQGELHAALRTLMPLTVGNMHTRISPAFDLPTALRFINFNLGYQGLFSIEAPGGHDAVRYIYNDDSRHDLRRPLDLGIWGFADQICAKSPRHQISRFTTSAIRSVDERIRFRVSAIGQETRCHFISFLKFTTRPVSSKPSA